MRNTFNLEKEKLHIDHQFCVHGIWSRPRTCGPELIGSKRELVTSREWHCFFRRIEPLKQFLLLYVKWSNIILFSFYLCFYLCSLRFFFLSLTFYLPWSTRGRYFFIRVRRVSLAIVKQLSKQDQDRGTEELGGRSGWCSFGSSEKK